MLIKVDKNFVNFSNDTLVNKKEYNVTNLEFEFSKEYEGLTCKAIFSNPSIENEYYQVPIIDNKCNIPYEVLDSNIIIIGVYAYELEGDELVLRYSPSPKRLTLLEGSYYEGASNPEEISPSQFEQYTAYLNSEIEKLNQINITTNKINNGVRINITNSNGVTTHSDIYNGEKGDKGDKGEPGLPGTTDYEDLTNKPSINGTTLEGDVSLEDIGIGSVFNIKGSVSTPEDLPMAGNSIGDVYYVESVMAGYVWIEVSGTERWEELGEPIDLSSYYTKEETDDLLDNKQDTLTAGTGIDITNNVISASGGSQQDTEVYMLTTDFSAVYQSTNLSSDDINTLNKYIDSYRAGKKCILMAQRMTFWQSDTQSMNSYNVPSTISINSSNRVKIEFYQNYKSGSSTYPISCANQSRTITIYNVGNPSNITSASLPSISALPKEYNLLSQGNTQSYEVTGNYNPAHKKYVDDKPTTYAGYDATKTQILKNINGTLTWVDE